jgi:hypothetical protein
MSGQDRQKRKSGSTGQANQIAKEAARFKGREFYKTLLFLLK